MQSESEPATEAAIVGLETLKSEKWILIFKFCLQNERYYLSTSLTNLIKNNTYDKPKLA